MDTNTVEQLTQVLKLLPEVIGTAAAVFVVVILRQLTAWLTAWIALQNIHIAAQTGVARALSADPTLTDLEAVKAGSIHVIDTMKESLNKVGGKPGDLEPILQSKIPEARANIAEDQKLC